ncbi:hypothetical protein NM688_g7635 [Phlebia brevispora]|uniref:Uncharacterized protein n=1 Tax=Phlebia brevispora TaxID=194682 RepID=A0ACC1S341_9APHY|nr:hypothetical protein NM688_g7635 [Phlebia brevispora]
MHPIGPQDPCWTIPLFDSNKSSVEYLIESTLRTLGVAHPVGPSSRRPFPARADSMAVQISGNAMEPCVFKLEKPKWRRVPHPERGPVLWWSRHEVQECKDPMDEEGYDESTAFPLLKPNIQVFDQSQPTALQRQRGWYQRKRWPPTKEKEVVRWTGAATGADVPQELFDNIIRSLAFSLKASFGKVKASKRERGWISLVCRRWANFIRPGIFERIELRNRDDAFTLLGFLRCPTSVISGYIQSLPLQLSVASYPYQPWIHTVCSVIHPRLAKKPRLELKIEGPLPANKIMKGVHEMLPRSYPYFSSELRKLSLDNIQFKSFGHLMNTIGEMPALERVRLQAATWNHSQDEEFRPPPARRAKFRRHPEYLMEKCTDDAAVVWLRLLLLCPGSGRLDEVDADRLYRTTSLLSNGTGQVACPNKEDMGPDTFAISSKHAHMHVILTLPVEGQPRNVRAIAFSLDNPDGCVDLDWKEIDNLIASFSALETLLFVFPNIGNLRPVHQCIITQKMANFADSPRLRYALKDSHNVEVNWVQVTCADDGTVTEIGPRYKGGLYGWKHLL